MQAQVSDGVITLTKAFRHRTFEERASEYGGSVSAIISVWQYIQFRPWMPESSDPSDQCGICGSLYGS